jgi:chromosome segregation ATPase
MSNSRELAEQAFSLLQDALRDSEKRAEELDAELKRQSAPKGPVEERVKVLEHRLESIMAQNEGHKREVEQLQEIIENERAKTLALKKKLDIAESGPDKADKKEINYWRSRAEDFDADSRKYRERIAELRQALREAQQAEPEATAPAAAEEGSRIAELEAQIAELQSRIPELQSQISERESQIGELQSQIGSRESEIGERESRTAELESRAAELESRAAEFEARAAELEAHAAEQGQMLAERDQRIADLSESEQAALAARQAITAQMAGLEQELKEEKECTINLSEIANERGEQITNLSEKLDEALERFEEAKWRLERAGRFERLVKKRRALIKALLEALRAKQKSNLALKAGLDALRKFKARAEKQQQDLLLRADELTSKLMEAKERLAEQTDLAEAEAKLGRANDKINGLETRLEAQVSVIENLESELHAAKAKRQERDNRSKELASLKETLEVKNRVISEMQNELDQQQRQLGKLRGIHSETQRLKVIQQEDQSLIDQLQLDNDNLKAELMELQVLVESCRNDPDSAIAEELRKREAQIADLEQTIQNQSKAIARLEEVAAGWQKKYEFISTDAPAAYQATTNDT